MVMESLWCHHVDLTWPPTSPDFSSLACRQVVVEPLSDVIAGTEYADLTVRQGSRVQADLRLDPSKQHLYVMTEKKVSPQARRSPGGV